MECARALGGDDERGPRLLHGTLKGGGHRVMTTLARDCLASEKGVEDLQLLGEALKSLPGTPFGKAERRSILVTASGADADLEPASRDVIDRDRRHRGEDRVAERDRCHHGADAHAPRLGGERAEERPGLERDGLWRSWKC